MMKEIKSSLAETYFDNVYAANPDPWDFEKSEYEKEKYQLTVGALTKPVYEDAFEIGCSIGVLSEMLLDKVKSLLAVDAAAAPLEKARQRLDKYPNAMVAKMNVPGEFGSGVYDLIIISEVAYYLNDADLIILRNKTLEHLAGGGQLIMVHWTPVVHDYPQTGDQVHDFFQQLTGSTLIHLHHYRHKNYRLDLWEKI